MSIYLDWLQAGGKISHTTKKRLKPKLRNWLYLFEQNHKRPFSEKECLALIIMELEGKHRVQILHKLHWWFTTLRHKREEKEMLRA